MYSDLNSENKNNMRQTFLDYQNLIEFFPNNINFIKKYYNLSNTLGYEDWVAFFEILLFKKNSHEIKLKELLEATTDNNLKKIIKLYTQTMIGALVYDDYLSLLKNNKIIGLKDNKSQIQPSSVDLSPQNSISENFGFK